MTIRILALPVDDEIESALEILTRGGADQISAARAALVEAASRRQSGEAIDDAEGFVGHA